MKPIFAALVLLAGLQTTTASERPLSLDTPTGTLYGTLHAPEGAQTVVLLIAGSGPTDRDGNNPLGVNGAPYRMLADSLAAHGIASLRYDKRGIAASQLALTNERDITLDTYIDDAVAWALLLRRTERFRRVVLAGHSEGALIAMEATPRAEADALVTLAGLGSPLSATLRRQLVVQLPTSLMLNAYAVIGLLEQGRAVPERQIAEPLRSLFRESVQPFLISVMRRDPLQLARTIDRPWLIVQGSADVQVAPEEAEKLRQAQPRAQRVLVEGMTHVLKPLSGEGMAAQQRVYADPTLPLSPELVPALVAFLRALE